MVVVVVVDVFSICQAAAAMDGEAPIATGVCITSAPGDGVAIRALLHQVHNLLSSIRNYRQLHTSCVSAGTLWNGR